MSSDRPPVARRSALAVAALALAAVAAATLMIAGAHIRPDGHGHAPTSGGQRAAPTSVLSAARSSPPPKQTRPSTATDLAGWFLYVLGLLGVGFALLILVALLRTVINRRRFSRVRHRATPAAPPDAADDLAVRLRAAVDGAIDEFGAGRPVRDSIIACWLRLEDASRAAGVEQVPSDTAEEAIQRVFAARTVRAAPLELLADLYREARFSRHPMGAAHAESARAALSEILADLGQASHVAG